MAVKAPLVLGADGRPQQLQSGDVISPLGPTPTYPKDLTADPTTTAGEIAVTWTVPAGAASVRIYSSATNTAAPATLVATVAAPTATYTITGLGNGVTRYIAVTAVGAGGAESGYSPVVECGTPVVIDTFTGTNSTAMTSHTPDLRPGSNAWTNVAGGAKIQSNQFVGDSIAGFQLNVQEINSGISDVEIRLAMTADAHPIMGLVYRGDGTSNSYWFFSFYDTSFLTDGLVLYKVVSGTPTAVGDVYPLGQPANGTTYQVRVRAVGSRHEVYVDGKLRCFAIDTTHVTNTYVGIRTTTGAASTSTPGTQDTLTVCPAVTTVEAPPAGQGTATSDAKELFGPVPANGELATTPATGSWTRPITAFTSSTFQLNCQWNLARLRRAYFRVIWKPGAVTDHKVRLVHADDGPTNVTEMAQVIAISSGSPANQGIDVTYQVNQLIKAGVRKNLFWEVWGDGVNAMTFYNIRLELDEDDG